MTPTSITDAAEPLVAPGFARALIESLLALGLWVLAAGLLGEPREESGGLVMLAVYGGAILFALAVFLLRSRDQAALVKALEPLVAPESNRPYDWRRDGA